MQQNMTNTKSFLISLWLAWRQALYKFTMCQSVTQQGMAFIFIQFLLSFNECYEPVTGDLHRASKMRAGTELMMAQHQV